jgi:D-alanyl-D-alanine carboxypeptidase/D-alanyl-D-alanine-endopeptidase (penicillin-binding protein 4)
MLVTERLGTDAGELVLSDGSGLSRENRVTAGLIAGWLASMAKDPRHGDAFVASMADNRSGKIAERFRGRKLTNLVHAKTGFINGVQSLSGYVTNTDSGKRVAYSVIVNNTQKASPGARVKEFHEDVVQIVDRHLSGK